MNLSINDLKFYLNTNNTNLDIFSDIIYQSLVDKHSDKIITLIKKYNLTEKLPKEIVLFTIDLLLKGKLTPPSKLFINQRKTALSVFNKMNKNSTRLQLLEAEMQMGKTGTMISLSLNQIKDYILGKSSIHNIIFGTAISHNDLKNQTTERVAEYFNSNIISNRTKVNSKDIHIFIFNNHGIKSHTQNTKIIRNSLLLLDECHFGEGEDGTLSQYFRKILCNRGYINPQFNNAVVAVSATPYTIVFDSDIQRDITRMVKPENYIGVYDLYQKSLIKNGHQMIESRRVNGRKVIALTEEYKNDVKNIINNSNKNGYYIMRVNDEKSLCQFLKEIPDFIDEELNFHIDTQDEYKEREKAIAKYNKILKSTNSKVLMEKQSINSILSVRPNKKTVILIKQKYKAGTTLCKDYLNGVYEFISSGDQKTDSIMQSLLGRMCGYDEHNCVIYTNMNRVYAYIHYWVNNNGDKVRDRDIANKVELTNHKMSSKVTQQYSQNIKRKRDRALLNSDIFEIYSEDIDFLLKNKGNPKESLSYLLRTYPDLNTAYKNLTKNIPKNKRVGVFKARNTDHFNTTAGSQNIHTAQDVFGVIFDVDSNCVRFYTLGNKLENQKIIKIKGHSLNNRRQCA